MATTPSLKIEKTMTYRGVPRVWSNRYHFNGGTPADSSHWLTLANAVTAAEKVCYTSRVTITGAVGYAAGSDVPVFTHTYSIAGTGSFSNDEPAPGDCAALIRYATSARTPKNHPVYLFNYFHGVGWDTTAGVVDQLGPGCKAAFNTFAGDWISGFSDGSITCVRAGPNGATATGSVVEQFITHRDFPR